MMTKMLLTTGMLVCALTIGCGDDDDSMAGGNDNNNMASLSDGDVEAAFTSIGSAFDGFDPSSGSGTTNCPDGGSFSFSGSSSQNGNTITFTYSFDYDNCMADGVTVDGALMYSGTISGTTATVMASGTITVNAGNAQETCSIDLNINTSTGQTTGTVCGRDAASLGG